MINLLETEDDQKKYNYMKGFFLRYNNQILLFRGDDFLESSSTFNNVYQVVVMDTDYVVNYAIHFSDNQLIGVSKFKYVDSENLELFCLILTDLDNTLLSQINILKLTDQDWLDKMFESKSTSDPNLIYIKSHTKSELFYRFVENSPDRL
jgi:Leucine-rich repeat (LRR) protein